MALCASFCGKCVVVTGGANGLGRALVERLVEDKAFVYALDKDMKGLEELQQEYPGSVHLCVIQVDLENWDETKAAIENIRVPIHHLVNNAGILKFKSFLEIEPEDFQKTIDVNLRSVIAVSQTVAKNMIKNKISGTIVNISSTASKLTHQGYSLYGTSKAALNYLSKNMAFELSNHNIRVNTICPTFMETGMVSPQVASILNQPNGFLQTRSLKKRLLKPAEAADLVLFLLSPLSEMITGEEIVIDGGASTN